MLPYKLPEAVH